MANARIARFVAEAAPPQFVSVIRQRASQMLDTIKEDEKEFSINDGISPRSASLSSASSSAALPSKAKAAGGFSKRAAGTFISLWQPGN